MRASGLVNEIVRSDNAGVHIAEWWPRLTPRTQNWLMEHNGEPVDHVTKAEVLAANGGVLESTWWSGETPDGLLELTDAAIDWIEARANDET